MPKYRNISPHPLEVQPDIESPAVVTVDLDGVVNAADDGREWPSTLWEAVAGKSEKPAKNEEK